MTEPVRRIVTGTDGEGRSSIVEDGPPTAVITVPEQPGYLRVIDYPPVPVTRENFEEMARATFRAIYPEFSHIPIAQKQHHFPHEIRWETHNGLWSSMDFVSSSA